MGLTAIRRLKAVRALEPREIARPAGREAAFALTALDDDSYEPLADIAHEIGRELGGDGLLVTWHEDAAEPRHLFADGACESGSTLAGDVAEVGVSAAKLRGGGARSHWRSLGDDDGAGVLTTSIPADRGVFTIATLFKRIGRSTRMKAGESAARLLPFVQPFFRTLLLRLRAEATAQALTRVVNASRVGVLFLDGQGQMIFANEAAEDLLNRADGIRGKGSTVMGGSMADTLRLHGAIDHAIAAGPARPAASDRLLVPLHRRSGRPLMAAVLPNGDAGQASADCAVILHVVDPDQDLQALIEPVCAYYRLSKVETRLTCALVQGQSVGEAAEQMHVREQTARTYLKQVFLKTDTNRQVDLVRLLLLSAARSGLAA